MRLLPQLKANLVARAGAKLGLDATDNILSKAMRRSSVDANMRQHAPRHSTMEKCGISFLDLEW